VTASISAPDVEVIDIDDDKMQSIDTKQSEFLLAFNESKDLMVENLHRYEESYLKQKVTQKDFDDFKRYRRTLTKWYSTCQRLKNKLTETTRSNEYLKMQFSISPAASKIRVVANLNTHEIRLKRLSPIAFSIKLFAKIIPSKFSSMKTREIILLQKR
jgi:hypothetical protein